MDWNGLTLSKEGNLKPTQEQLRTSLFFPSFILMAMDSPRENKYFFIITEDLFIIAVTFVSLYVFMLGINLYYFPRNSAWAYLLSFQESDERIDFNLMSVCLVGSYRQYSVSLAERVSILALSKGNQIQHLQSLPWLFFASSLQEPKFINNFLCFHF